MNMYEQDTLDRLIEAEQAEILQLQDIVEDSRKQYVDQVERQCRVLMFVGFVLLWIILVYAIAAGIMIQRDMLTYEYLHTYIVLVSGFSIIVMLSKHVRNLREYRQSLQVNIRIEDLEAIIRKKQDRVKELLDTKEHIKAVLP